MAVFVAPVIENGSLEDTLVRCIRGMDERLPFVSVADAGQARRVVEAFKRADRKGVSQEHLLLRMLSTAGILGGGAYYQALAKAEQGGAPARLEALLQEREALSRERDAAWEQWHEACLAWLEAWEE